MGTFTTAYGIFKPIMAEFSDAEWARTFAGAMAQTVASFKAGIPRFLRSPPSNATKKKETPGLTR